MTSVSPQTFSLSSSLPESSLGTPSVKSTRGSCTLPSMRCLYLANLTSLTLRRPLVIFGNAEISTVASVQSLGQRVMLRKVSPLALHRRVSRTLIPVDALTNLKCLFVRLRLPFSTSWTRLIMRRSGGGLPSDNSQTEDLTAVPRSLRM